jgi:tetratricopeptide (TPR) repeat protein
VIQAILQHGDSRPWHIRELFPLIEESLEDLDLEERWLAYLDHAAAADSAYWVGRLRYMRRDRDGILRLLSAERLVPKQSLRLIYQLQRLVGDESPFVETALRKQITTFPGSYHLNRDLAILLRNRGRYDDARAVIEKWLALSLPDPGLERSFAYTELAKIRLKEGKLKEALSLAERAVQSGAAYPWFVQVQILEALKRDDEADSQLRALLARYPDSWGGTAWLAEILWRRGKSKEAAEFLQSAQRGRHFGAWKSQIAPGFTRVFTKRPVEDVVAAISALQSAGFISTYFEILAQAFEKREQWAPANAIRQSFLKQKTADPRALLSAFRSEQALHGSTAAAEWAAKNTQRNATLSAAAAAEGELELPWLLPEETNPALAPSFWLTRAMVWLDAGCAEGERHDRLRAWAREPRGKGYEALIRHIAGDSTLDELWRSSADVPGKTYAAGLRALAEGRAPEASQWFRIAVELDSEEFADRAERRLTLLRRRGESLSRIPALCGKSVARSDS